MQYGLKKFSRYAVNVWNVNPENKTDEQIANEGLTAMQSWMEKIGLVMNLSQLGVKAEMIDGITKSTLVMDGGYKILNEEDIKAVLKASL